MECFHLLSETLPLWRSLIWNTEMDLEESRRSRFGKRRSHPGESVLPSLEELISSSFSQGSNKLDFLVHSGLEATKKAARCKYWDNVSK